MYQSVLTSSAAWTPVVRRLGGQLITHHIYLNIWIFCCFSHKRTIRYILALKFHFSLYLKTELFHLKRFIKSKNGIDHPAVLKLAQFFNHNSFRYWLHIRKNQLSMLNKIILLVITLKQRSYCSEFPTPLIFSSERWHYNGDTIKQNNGRVFQYLSPSREPLRAVFLSKTIQLFVCDTIVNNLELWANTKKGMLK